MTATRVEPDAARACRIGPLSDFVVGKWVFVPAFCVSGVSLGFGMHEFNYSQGDSWGADFMMYMRAEFRFVRNEAKGELLVLHDIPEMNACCMEYSRTVTPTCQTRTSICLFRDKLHAAAESGYLDRANIIPCLDQINTIYEYRDCPTCGASHTTCPCTLQLARAKHPFDHDTFVVNMSQRLGTFEGVASVFCYDTGRFKRKTALGSRTTLRGGMDHDLITTMRDWAVNLHAKDYVNPFQTITAPPQPQVQQPSHSSIPSAHETTEIDLSTESFMQPASFFLDDEDPLRDLPPLEGLTDDGNEFMNLLACMNWKLPKSATPRPDPSPKQYLDEIPEKPTGKPRNIQPLLDLTGSAAVQSERSSNDNPANAAEEESVRQLKAEMRKQRNRESAHRSNMKKKAMNDKLKFELKSNRDRADALRIQESALRQENIRLRRMLTQADT